ncbi:hypothetical protein [Streptomyces akebiae]|uniref:Integral membrane protein n=1 Tax=Streptomyces akebiae TaxID=2865673 RepID=A0ABX8XU52_9ACTN|nr:hypothetical protein [Streptomyces akebiae]QYX79168.1 hypothetical protein K1J60_23985 [Streptomyces akebiae]
MNWPILIIGAAVGVAGTAFLLVGLLLFLRGSSRDTARATAAEGQQSVWDVIWWLLKKSFAIAFGGDKYSPAQRGMAQGLLIIGIGLLMLLGGLGMIAGAVAADQAKTQAVEVLAPSSASFESRQL